MKFCFPVRRNLVVNNHGKTKQMENEATIFENYKVMVEVTFQS